MLFYSDPSRMFQPYVMGSGTNPASASTSTTSQHRIHPPPSSSVRESPFHHQQPHRIHPPPQSHPYAYYLPEPNWQGAPQPIPTLPHTYHQTDPIPSTEHEDGHVMGQEHEHITPHPFCSYMYPAQIPPLPLQGPRGLQESGPLKEMNNNTLPIHGPTGHCPEPEVEHPGYDHNHDEGEDEISPALSERILQDLGSPSLLDLLDPELEDAEEHEQVEQDHEDEYKPKVKKGKGKATGGVKKAKGKAKGKGKGRAGSKQVPAASRRRTTVKGEARPLGSTFNPNIDDDGDAPFEARDTDSHIDVAYFPNLRNITYPLLAPPEGTFLDVNDLLILHPPALSSSDDTHVPINQYNKGGQPEGSKWEMYTCRGCRKTYDGKNARSVARRHLQDKHGIPLSQQARRTRWDMEGNRPANEAEAQERSKKCKRDWAKVMRQQRSLEKLHGDFLLQFGPAGLKTTWKQPLIAPLYRDNQKITSSDDEEPWKTAEEVTIPRSLTESISILAKLEYAVEHNTSLPFVSFEDLLQLDSDTDNDVPPQPKKRMTSNGSLLTLPTSPLKPNFQPYTSTPDSDRVPNAGRVNQSQYNQSQHGPIQQYPATLASASAMVNIPARRQRDTRNDTSPTTSASPYANNSPEVGDYTLRLLPVESVQEEEEDDDHPPLYVQPAWQEWHEYPSNSSSSLRAIGQALLAGDEQVADLPSIHVDDTSNAVNGEAAKTLLDLHSTPVRGGESSRSPTPEPVDAALLAHARLAIEEEQNREHRSRSRSKTQSQVRPKPQASPATQAPWMNGIASLIATYSSASNPSRETFLRHEMQSRPKQPFLSRPGHLQRSLSGTITLDDPFVLESNGISKNDTPPNRSISTSGSRVAQTLLTGSPVIRRDSGSGSKRKAPTSPMNRTMRAPLQPILPNRVHSTGHVHSPKKSSNFQTPLRSSRANGAGIAPMTNGAGMGWMQFSSPADPAASLGLAPTHAVPTTPGLSMIIGQDTPVGGKRR